MMQVAMYPVQPSFGINTQNMGVLSEVGTNKSVNKKYV